MTEKKKEKTCFIIMPISTPDECLELYNDDPDHFEHVLEWLFIPAIKKAGYIPIPPKTKGSKVIQADIIKKLRDSDLVLCDMSSLNPNVFYECGIRTALNKSVALVVDIKTKEGKKVPFDLDNINYEKYRSEMKRWEIDKDIEILTDHLKESSELADGKNELWKIFEVSQVGHYKPEEAKFGDKMDLILREVQSIKDDKAISNENRRVLEGVVRKVTCEVDETDLFKKLVDKQSLWNSYINTLRIETDVTKKKKMRELLFKRLLGDANILDINSVEHYRKKIKSA